MKGKKNEQSGKLTQHSEAVYKKTEILTQCSAFSVSKELMAGALRLSDKEEFTRGEVDSLIQKFKKRGA